MLVAAFVLLACTSEPSAVVVDDPTDQASAADGGEPLTPFGERLYGSAWSVVQGQLGGEAIVANGAFPQQQLGGFSFYGTRTELSISVNHSCGSVTSPVEITDDRIIPADFAVPSGCGHLTLFNLLAQPEVAAAFNGGRLELTGTNASLAAVHFASVSDNGVAPEYLVGEPVAVFLPWAFTNPEQADDGSVSAFDITVNPGECSGPRGPLLEPELTYGEDEIRIAVAAALPPNRGVLEQTSECRWPPVVTIELDEPRNGRPIVVSRPPDRPLRPDER